MGNWLHYFRTEIQEIVKMLISEHSPPFQKTRHSLLINLISNLNRWGWMSKLGLHRLQISDSSLVLTLSLFLSSIVFNRKSVGSNWILFSVSGSLCGGGSHNPEMMRTWGGCCFAYVIPWSTNNLSFSTFETFEQINWLFCSFRLSNDSKLMDYWSQTLSN